ncbi:MAG: FAD-dependent oxidoreductase [Beijerinckiaceae bacterium]|nr:FAD-dependent oxidoreductase [Beijerinckiaceae bacterium]
MPIAIIGAGMAGLSCARALTQAGESVTVFEKSRGIGGRCATRRGEHGSYDHGAPYVEAWTVNFKAMLAAGSLTGACVPWPEMNLSDSVPAFVGVPGMSALAKPLSAECDLRLGTRAERIERGDAGWSIRDAAGASHGPFSRLCIAVPAPQAVDLLGSHRFAAQAGSAVMSPCWTLMVSGGDRIVFGDGRNPPEPFAKIIVDSEKPERAAEPRRFVIHMSAAWSRAHLEFAPDEVKALITAELGRSFGFEPKSIASATAHRWRYALTETPLGEACLWDEAAKLGVCGDWCLGRHAENAFLSGLALADRVLGR